jgi:thioredoxin-like negative regulator of GroEL
MSWRIIRNWAILIVILAIGALSLAKVTPSLTQPDTPYALLYYYQAGCPACDEIEPTIDALEARHTGCVTVRRLNVQWRRADNVRATPTVLLVDSEGEEIARWVGAVPLRDFTRRIDPLCQ